MEGLTLNGLRPTSRSQAKIWNRFSERNFDWYPIKYWPRFLARAVITQRLTYKLRFSLFVYFVGNGIAPRRAREIIESIKDFDESALRHLKNLEDNSDQVMQKYKYFDETLHKWV